MAGALIIFGAATFVSCDERNEADIPAVVYSLKHNIVTAGVALNVDLKDNLLGVAAASSGTYVYDIANIAAPAEVFHYEQVSDFYSSHVAIDVLNGLVMTGSEPSGAPGDKYPIHSLSSGLRIGASSFSGPLDEMIVVSTTSRFDVWATDTTPNDGFTVSSYCYDEDAMRFLPNCVQDRFGFANSNVRARGFGKNGDIFAVAMANFLIAVHDIRVQALPREVLVPGDPYDCAWYGDYILVADNLFLTVVNATNIDSPSVVKTLTIPGADRLQRIVVDGSYAVLLDDADGVYIVDVSTPTNPKHVQSISLPEPTSISSSNGTLAVSDEQLGVLIYQR